MTHDMYIPDRFVQIQSWRDLLIALTAEGGLFKIEYDSDREKFTATRMKFEVKD